MTTELTQGDIREARGYCDERLQYWNKRLRSLQASCRHPETERVPRSQTGYSEPTVYWYACKCDDCGKQWDEDQ